MSKTTLCFLVLISLVITPPVFGGVTIILNPEHNPSDRIVGDRVADEGWPPLQADAEEIYEALPEESRPPKDWLKGTVFVTEHHTPQEGIVFLKGITVNEATGKLVETLWANNKGREVIQTVLDILRLQYELITQISDP